MHVREILQKWNTSCSKDLLQGMSNESLPSNGRRKAKEEFIDSNVKLQQWLVA